MRELKFRAYIEENRRKSFEYIDLNATNADELMRFHAVTNKSGAIKEQYTNLKDKNGKEIYEGDIVQDSEGEKCRVEWNESEAHFGLCVGEQMELTDFIWMRGEDLEVIGNVHEDNDLLEKKWQ